VRKALRNGQQLVVTADAQALAQLDELLWTFEKLEFLPHVRLPRGQRLTARLARTPVCLCERAEDGPQRQLLLNLGGGMAAPPGEWARVIELVGLDDTDVLAGRQRWRQYTAAGLTPKLHQLS
jgi:DNA polymerase-3 subunit chi